MENPLHSRFRRDGAASKRIVPSGHGFHQSLKGTEEARRILHRWLGTHAACRALAPLGLLLLVMLCHAQDIEPRRWSHLPLDANFLGVGYAYTNGDIFLNPVIQIENGKFDLDTYSLKYIRSFELFDKSARIDITQYYQSGEWSGLQAGQPVSTEHDGWADTTVRFAVNLLGAPPLASVPRVKFLNQPAK